MDWAPRSAIGGLFDSGQGLSNRLIPRWVVLRCLGGIYFSAFFSLIFQIRGLIGPEGILPAGEYLQSVARSLGYARFWFAPTLLWISSGPRMLTGLCWVGMIASLLLLFNVWPRGSLVVCFVCFLSFVSAAEDFSGYQSDGMLLEAGFISLFFAPPGFRPGWGAARPPSRASLFLLQWEWFRIYFESGIAKIASGDPQWRHFTAMDEYYQNGPLPTWVGWYVQHLPHWFHASTSAATLVLELIFVWMMFLPRRLRMVCFLIVTPWEAGVILTANYTFLNYLVLALGFLLLDDKFLLPFLPERWTRAFLDQTQRQERHHEPAENEFSEADRGKQGAGLKTALKTLPLSVSALMLSWIFYATTVQMIWMLIRLSLPTSPVTVLEPFRIANRYGLFAVMTRGRYEIEFQGSQDGEHWVAYPFRYKPQDTSKPPGIYAPYQPRFDWNLWFASLGFWRENAIVPSTEERLLSNAPDVLKLFAGHPFPNQPPRLIRAVLWQYWFTTVSERRAQGQWWRRQWLGLYAPTLQREADGKIAVVEWPTVAPRQ
jgi:lipase maturation factor